jgi:FMN phosphatase YigB (HAD superfamily)
MIKNIIFDFGGVIVTIDQQQAVRRFEEIGLKNAAECLYTIRYIWRFGRR